LYSIESVGVEVFGLLDRDREVPASKQSSSRICKLPYTNVENALLHPEALYKACRSLAGEHRLRREGISGPSDIEKMLESIIDEDEYLERSTS
jgi:hypothetical protein